MENNKFSIVINFDHFSKECSIDYKDALKEKKYQIKMYFKAQNNILNYNNYNEDYASNINVCIDKNNMVKILFSYEEFIHKILEQLNIDLYSKNKKIDWDKQINKLKNIAEKKELQDKFPILYNKYITAEDQRKLISPILDYSNNNKELKKASGINKYYYACGMRYIVSKYANEQVNYYNNIKEKRKYIKNYISNNNLLIDLFNMLDMEKTYFYLTNEIIDNAFICDDKDKLNCYSNFLSNYFKAEHNTSIHDEKGLEITFDMLKCKYDNLIAHKYNNECLLDWELLPEGNKDYNTSDNIRGTLKLSKNFLKRKKLAEDKMKFYGNTPYVAKAKGISINNGYTAYFYNNGNVILERMPNNSGSAAGFGNAAYILNSLNFEYLSKMNKTDLRKEKLCPIIMHKKNWENKMSDIINEEITENKKEEINKILQKIKKKDSN